MNKWLSWCEGDELIHVMDDIRTGEIPIMAKVETLFILRDADHPLSVGDVIEAQGMLKYHITVKQIVGTQPIGDKIQWKIKGVREVVE